MSQRNPMNERYTTDKPQGTTRKSAASAKPVSKAGASVRTSASKTEKKGLFGGSKSTPAPAKASKPAKQSSSSSSSAKEVKATPLSKEEQAAARKSNKELERQSKQASRERNRAINRFVPEGNAEFKRLNRKRMIYSGIGFGGMIVAIILSLLMPEQPFIPIGLMVVAWVFFFVGMRIDTQQMRPLREQGYDKWVRQQEKKARKKK